MKKIVIASLAGLAFLTGCSSGPPSARSLAQQIPHCRDLRSTGTNLNILEVQQADCILPTGVDVSIVTFASQGDERKFIAQGQLGTSCAVEGSLWAGFVTGTGPYGSMNFQPVVAALGGRSVCV